MNNMTTYYDEKEQDWWLCNHNYHQMVQVMIKIVQNTSLIRFDAPEWYPKGTIVSSNLYGMKSEEWQIPRRCSKGKNVVGKVNEQIGTQEINEKHVKNYCEVLSDNDDDELEDNTYYEPYNEEKTRYACWHP